MLGHCSFAKIRCLPKLWAKQCSLSNPNLAKHFGCRLLHVPKENSSQSSHLGMNKLGLKAESHMSSIKSHRSSVDIFPHCLMALLCSCMQEASSSQQSSHILHLFASEICTQGCILFSGFYTQEQMLLSSRQWQPCAIWQVCWHRSAGPLLRACRAYACSWHQPSWVRCVSWWGSNGFCSHLSPWAHTKSENHLPSRQVMTAWRHLASLVCH